MGQDCPVLPEESILDIARDDLAEAAVHLKPAGATDEHIPNTASVPVLDASLWPE
jgi:hypothetical protein